MRHIVDNDRLRTFFASLVFLIFMSLALAGGSLAGLPSQEPTPTRVPSRHPHTPSPDVQPQSVGASSISSATAQELALAMGVPSGDLLAADLMGSDSQGVGVSDSPLGSWFPTQGSTFAILSTGKATDASRPNNEEDLSTILGGLDNNQGTDLVRLHLGLKAPAYANCVNFDFAFYSEEFEEYVGSIFNDTFTAQLNNSSIEIVGSEVTAPNNFAFDTQGNIISVNTVFGVSGPTGTTYDGVTPRLRARTAVTPSAEIDIYFSIQDLGDSEWDSAVFLDKFFWSEDPACSEGAQADTDGDGLLDDWEIRGLTVTVGAVTDFVDLPAMGADPQHKDIFVEIDYMGPPSAGAHTHKPKAAAIQSVVNAFDNAPVSNPDGTTGIHLHVDYGSDAPLTWGSAATWGALSHGEQLSHDANLGTGSYNWDEFDTIKSAHLTPGRAAIVHYCVFGHNLSTALGSTSGISRNASGAAFGSGASDFIVSLGSWTDQVGTANEQAGTFMHELGHNLGLRHGGPDHTQWKPSYLSVMNYANQTRGLIINNTTGHMDYSRYDLADLDENNLDETVGINIPATVTDTLGTRHFCGLDDMRSDMNASSVDWNCDGDQTDTGVSANINQGMSWNNNTTLDTLTSQNDWDNLVYSGGAIGAPGADVPLPETTEPIDIDVDEDSDIPTLYKVAVIAPSPGPAPPGTSVELNFTVRNLGQNDDTYTLQATSKQGWPIASAPTSVAVPAGEERTVQVVIQVSGLLDQLTLLARSQASSQIIDEGVATIQGEGTRVYLPIILKNYPP